MEMQEAVQQNGNHVADNAPAPVVETAVAPATSIELKVLMERREKMIQGLNGAKAEKLSLQEQVKQMEQQIAQQEESVKRTEGALIMLNTLITELDPYALQQPQRGG